MKLSQILSTLREKQKSILITLLELSLIATWALWIGRPYLDFNSNVWPAGGEYIMSIQNNYNWQMISKCGACFFWNGFTNGGAPAFIDTHGSWLHPVSSIPTLLFGTFNGGKLTFILSIFMAGVAQWWLGKVLKIGTLARLWGALLVVAGGHLSGRMDLSSLSLVVSTAACSLVIPPAFQLALNGGKKTAIVVGITLGLAALSGQGYLQAGLIASLVPAIFYLLVETTPAGIRINSVWKKFLISGVLAFLIAAVLIVPILHNLSYLNKDVDPQFSSAQPIKYGLLNLVIDDADFLRTSILGKTPFPYLYSNYIGWIPLGFALIALMLTWREHRKIFISFGIALCMIYLVSSATLLRLIGALPFGGFASGLRNPGVIEGLAIPFIVALSSLGLEQLLKKEWPKLTIMLAQTSQAFGKVDITFKWIVLIIPMFLALNSLYNFSKLWIWTTVDDNSARVRTIQDLKTPEAEWVQPVFGVYFWLPVAIENNLKIRFFFRPWSLRGAEMPKAFAELSLNLDGANLPGFQKIVDDMVLLVHPEYPYAYTTDEQTKNPCKASAMGGNIDVVCDSNIDGNLVVTERALSGWSAFMDGKNVRLVDAPWLTTPSPAGKHVFSFRYRPWDAILGIILSLLGWVVSIYGLIIFSKAPRIQPVEQISD